MSEGAREDPGDWRTLAGQSLWNFAGLTLPLLLALVAIPLLVEHLGKERFGVLGIVGLVIGYMSVFDLGLGQAQGYFIADRRGRGRVGEAPVVFWTGVSMIFVLGAVFSALAFFLGDWFATSVLQVEPELEDEVAGAFRVVPFVVPFVMLTPCLVATLEAYQEFRLVNLIRIPTGAAYILAPLLVLPFTSSLVAVVAALGIGRLIETVVFFHFCRRKVGSGYLPRPSGFYARGMVRFGGWMTVTNIVQPAMIHGDRFFLGGMRGLVAVAYYVTPAELIVRLLVVPRSLVTALFPNLTMRFAGNRGGVEDLFSQSLLLLTAILSAGAGVLVVFGPWALGLWLGEDFRANSGPVLRWLSVGIVALSLAYVPQFLVQASGKPSHTALAHLGQLPVYVLLAWAGIALGGVTGAAIAWALRGAIELAVMLVLARRRLPGMAGRMGRLVLSFSAAIGMLLAMVFLPDTGGGMALGSVLIGIQLVLAWCFLIGRAEKELLGGVLNRLFNKA
ncbi:MAG: flippase [Puniceicoccaceae bacterium]